MAKFQEIKGGPREGSGGAVSEATSAAATGCKRCANGLTFSSPTAQESTFKTTVVHNGQSILVVSLASTPSSPKATIFIPPALEHTIWVSVGFKMGDAMATPMKSANHNSTKRAINLWLVAVDMYRIIAEVN
jgi:hypothetical protein